MSIIRDLAAIGAVILMSAPAGAAEASIAGDWETGPRDVRYRFELCGDSGQDLCAVMTHALDPNPSVQRYVGKTVMDGARRIGPASWKGRLVLAGYQFEGTITLVEPDKIEIDGCALLIMCGEFAMYREGSDVAR